MGVTGCGPINGAGHGKLRIAHGGAGLVLDDTMSLGDRVRSLPNGDTRAFAVTPRPSERSHGDSSLSGYQPTVQDRYRSRYAHRFFTRIIRRNDRKNAAGTNTAAPSWHTGGSPHPMSEPQGREERPRTGSPPCNLDTESPNGASSGQSGAASPGGPVGSTSLRRSSLPRDPNVGQWCRCAESRPQEWSGPS